MMTKRQKRQLYRLLIKTFGDPLKMNSAAKKRALIPLGGWLMQARGVRGHDFYRDFRWNVSQIPTRPHLQTPDESNSVYRRHAELARQAAEAATPASHWNIQYLVQLPKENAALGVPNTAPDYGYAPRGADWDYSNKGFGKCIAIMVPINYHLTVDKAGVHRDGRRVVQRVWNHRVYSDKEAWECSYWDFTGLGRDENTWITAKWYEGYVVKTSTQMAVASSLTRAISLAMTRTVQGSIKSIMSDDDT